MAIALLLLAVTRLGGAIHDSADVVEVNHLYDASGHLVFDQVIWWENTRGEPCVVAWRVLRNVRGPKTDGHEGEFKGGHATPLFCHRKRLWCSHWYDEKSRCRRVVTATAYRETWTTHDPELQDRKWTPCAMRRRLTRP